MSVSLSYIGLICYIDATSITQYIYYTDGVTIIRKGVRDSEFVIDIALTETGFDGTENTDWINIKTVG